MMIESQTHRVSNTQTTTINVDHNEKLMIPSAEKPQSFGEILERFKFKWERDSIGEARSTLLIVVALIVTVTFQAGINPPTVLFDNNNIEKLLCDRNSTLSVRNSTSCDTLSDPEKVGMIAFLICNTIAFSAAGSIIDYLMRGLPFRRELNIAIIFMGGAYVSSVWNTKLFGRAKSVFGRTEHFILIGSAFLPQLVRWLPIITKKLGLDEKLGCY